MDNQIPNTDNMSMSQLNVLTNVKDLGSEKKNYLHVVVLFVMVIFVLFVVGLSVYNFEGLVQNKNIKVVNAQGNHSKDVQTLTNE